MQYYKGKALVPDVSESCPATERKRSLVDIILKILVFPFMVCYWSLQNVVYKSLEEND